MAELARVSGRKDAQDLQIGCNEWTAPAFRPRENAIGLIRQCGQQQTYSAGSSANRLQQLQRNPELACLAGSTRKNPSTLICRLLSTLMAKFKSKDTEDEEHHCFISTCWVLPL